MLRHRQTIPAAAVASSAAGSSLFAGAQRGLSLGLPDKKHSVSLLLAAACIPLLLFAAYAAYQTADSQRSAALVRAQDTVGRVGERITAEMTNQTQVAEALALSPSLDAADLATFYREAQRLKSARPLWYTVELDSPDGIQVFNLLRPFGDPLGPTADRESFDEALQTKRPVIGGIGPVGPVSGRHLLSLRVPVIRDGLLRYVLSVEMTPDAVSAILRDAGLPPGWVGAVADRHGNLVARSLSEAASLGRSGSPSLHEAIGKSTSGIYRGQTLEGVPVDTIFRTLPDVGAWSVHLGIPSKALNGPLRRALFAVAAGVLVSLAIAAFLTAMVARGIAEQRKAEGQLSAAALSASESRADLAIEAAALGVWAWDVAGDRVTGSERCRSLLDLPAGPGTLGWTSAVFFGAIHPDDRERVRKAAEACLKEDQPFAADFRVATADGRLRWLRGQGRSNRDQQDGALTLHGIVADIGAQKRAETERIDLLRRLAGAQEDVQRRIAHDLHDSVGQTVTGLSLGLKSLQHALEHGNAQPGQPSLGDHVRWLQGLTTEIGRDIHQASADLRPTALDDLGFPRALGALIDDWNGRYGISADVQILGESEPRLPAEIETVLYRVVQEALTNVLKHAQAQHVSLVFEQRLRNVRVVVEDDGKGFDADESGRDRSLHPGGRRRLGLSGMRERLAMVGGALRVESSSAGTTLFVSIAIDPSVLPPV